MSTFHDLYNTYGSTAFNQLRGCDIENLGLRLKEVSWDEINSAEDGRIFISLVRKYREAIADVSKLNGEHYLEMLNSLLSVGEDGLYSNNLRFFFELIQNVDDCDFLDPQDCKLDIRFDYSKDEIVLKYNEVGFSPFNVFAITGIAEAAKNISASKVEIGEKGIGFKSVFGVAEKVMIRSGWFSFSLFKDNTTIPIENDVDEYCPGTIMTLIVPGKAKSIYTELRNQFCCKEALFGRNPLLFLNKLSSLKIYYDSWRSMEFHVSRTNTGFAEGFHREDNVILSVNLKHYENNVSRETVEKISCTRYTYPILISQDACRSRYGESTKVGKDGGKKMLLQAVLPSPEDCSTVGTGGLYSFLPTQIGLTVPIVFHAPFKLDASREFVDPQNENLWFQEVLRHLSKLMDHVYSDWCRVVGTDIVRYLPGLTESLFALNNGKEKRLREKKVFSGEHYLQLPLLLTSDGDYKPADEVFCFDPNENVSRQEEIKSLLGLTKSLFYPPASEAIGKFGIRVERDINNRLYSLALTDPKATKRCIEYLDSENYDYPEKCFPKYSQLSLSIDQLTVLLKQKRIADIMLRIASESIKGNKRPNFSVSDDAVTSLHSVLDEGFELADTPKAVEKYLNLCRGNCFTADLEENAFLPCYNGIVLSKDAPDKSFASFCYEIDPNDTFAIRVKLKEASNQLNRYITENKGTASEYLRDLGNIRRTVRDSLGKTGYKSYIELILKCGFDSSRFIQELLQNADDCIYPDDRIPTFSLSFSRGRMIAEYNEAGFTRENIRAITAIGESTKNRLLSGDLQTIGEKGVGFKSVFTRASKVCIYSGEYNFWLSSDEPTIPKILAAPAEPVQGTRMDLTLRDSKYYPIYQEKDVLELCLCLRKLKSITIGSHEVSIQDTENRRIITIDKKQYSFDRYTYSFEVTNPQALEEREGSSKKISRSQKIVCYVPDRLVLADYALYVGLPTKHRMNIPIAIDAPFELTTSREQIETDCAAWNNIIREKMYDAIIQVIHQRKSLERANVLRFAKVTRRFTGNQSSAYFNDISDFPYLNNYDYLTRLRNEDILPTFNKQMFASVKKDQALKYPEATCWLLSNIDPTQIKWIVPSTVIDPDTGKVSKDMKDRVEAVLNALECREAIFAKAYPFIAKYAEEFVPEEEFRVALYDYLQNAPESYQDTIAELKIIPVYKTSGGIEYVRWVDDRIFVKKGATKSTDSYWVLAESILAKSLCEKMVGRNINELNDEWEKTKYNENLIEIIRNGKMPDIYNFLLREYNNGNLQKNNAIGTLLVYKECIPLKNQLGEIVDTELFLCDQQVGYFATPMLQRLIVHEECAKLAKELKCLDLNGIHYENIDYYENLTQEDVESLMEDYFLYSEENLRSFYRDGYLSDELLSDNNLEYLLAGTQSVPSSEYEFPEESVTNRKALQNHINELWRTRRSIITVQEMRTVQKVHTANGRDFALDSKEARIAALKRYSPADVKGMCFCQMCKKLKNETYIEVNNIEKEPKFYFPQMRVSLCLECSKTFEFLRNRESFRLSFYEVIRKTYIGKEAKYDIPIGKKDTITFTAKHLAEIQEILEKIDSQK